VQVARPCSHPQIHLAAGAQALSLNEFTGIKQEYNGKSCAGATAAELTMLAHLYRGEMYALTTAGTRRWLLEAWPIESF
jgi:hypothetical protein